jgi:hypothetical protein
MAGGLGVGALQPGGGGREVLKLPAERRVSRYWLPRLVARRLVHRGSGGGAGGGAEAEGGHGGAGGDLGKGQGAEAVGVVSAVGEEGAVLGGAQEERGGAVRQQAVLQQPLRPSQEREEGGVRSHGGEREEGLRRPAQREVADAGDGVAEADGGEERGEDPPGELRAAGGGAGGDAGEEEALDPRDPYLAHD